MYHHFEAAIHLLSFPPPALEYVIPSSLRSAKIVVIDLRLILPWDVETER